MLLVWWQLSLMKASGHLRCEREKNKWKLLKWEIILWYNANYF